MLVELTGIQLQSDRREPIFSDLNFQLKAGNSAIIVGEAGSGKTSLIELLIGKRWANGGFVEVLGQVLKRGKVSVVRKVRRGIGGVGGIFGLIPTLTVADNILLPLILIGSPRKTRRDRLLRVLSEFSLLKQANAYPQSLTRVERTLAEFARASIAHQPLMLIDEPLAGLDRKTYGRILDFLKAASLSGRSMIIVTAEGLSEPLPNTTTYQISSGKFA
jgi:putative ABC transport system ATP-binding protein